MRVRERDEEGAGEEGRGKWVLERRLGQRRGAREVSNANRERDERSAHCTPDGHGELAQRTAHRSAGYFIKFIQ